MLALSSVVVCSRAGVGDVVGGRAGGGCCCCYCCWGDNGRGVRGGKEYWGSRSWGGRQGWAVGGDGGWGSVMGEFVGQDERWGRLPAEMAGPDVVKGRGRWTQERGLEGYVDLIRSSQTRWSCRTCVAVGCGRGRGGSVRREAWGEIRGRALLPMSPLEAPGQRRACVLGAANARLWGRMRARCCQRSRASGQRAGEAIVWATTVQEGALVHRRPECWRSPSLTESSLRRIPETWQAAATQRREAG